MLHTKEKLSLALNKIESALKEYLPLIMAIESDSEKRVLLREFGQADSIILTKRKNRVRNKMRKAFQYFFKNKYRRAINILSIYKNELTTHEKRLLKFMKKKLSENKEDEFKAVDEELNFFEVTKKNKRRRFLVFISYIASWPLGMSLCSIPFYLLYLLYYKRFDALYIIKTDIEFSLLPGIFVGIFGSLLFTDKIVKLLLGKKYDEYKAYEKLFTSPSDNIILKWFFGIILVCSYLLMFLVLRWNMIFYGDRFIDNSKFQSILVI